MINYIFVTSEGHTFQPNSKSIEPDIENLQAIGFSQGKNSKDAFRNLLKENKYLMNTTFNAITSYELNTDHKSSKCDHFLSEIRELGYPLSKV